jgi:hypothetical protein
MIGYRFLPPAEEEMTQASLFYEAASTGLGSNFLDDVSRVIERLRQHPYLGQTLALNLRKTLLHRFPFSLSIQSRRMRFLSLPLPITAGVQVIGKNGLTAKK